MQSVGTYWKRGRVVDGRPRYARPWAWLAGVLLAVLLADLCLTLRLRSSPAPWPGEQGVADDVHELRARLRGLAEAAARGQRAILLVGDSVLAGEVLAESIAACERPGLAPELARLRGCASLRGVDPQQAGVLGQMRAELAPRSEAYIAQIALDGLLPVDMQRIVAELDRIDPSGRVELLLELNLRYFSEAYTEQRSCTRPSLCQLGRVAVADHDAPRLSVVTLEQSADLAEDWLHDRIPVHRHRERLRGLGLDFIEALATPAGAGAGEAVTDPAELRVDFERQRAQGQARVAEHYRSARLTGVQYRAIESIARDLAARRRPASFFLTPIEDAFVEASSGMDALGARHEKLARTINDIAERGDAPLGLLHLDHPMFEASLFLDHVHLRPEGNRLLALNLLHELGLPLARRPYDWMMIHDEDHDRSLLARRGQGNAHGGAWEALLKAPRGLAVSRDGSRVVVADTRNHVLRQLRGNMQVLEVLAGKPGKPGPRDGTARGGRLDNPRWPQLVGDAVYFIDGEESDALRVLAGDELRTLRLDGPRCPHYDWLTSGEIEGRDWLIALCSNDRILGLELGPGGGTHLLVEPRELAESGLVRQYNSIELGEEGRLFVADGDSKIWSIQVGAGGRTEPPELEFDNRGAVLLLTGSGAEYPFTYDQMRFEQIVQMEWVERYGLLLVSDLHEVGPGANKRLRRQLTERVHVRALDLDSELIYPWVKALPHGEAFHMRNVRTENYVSYFHLGAMAMAQDDASLFWLERGRTRLLRVADGLLGVQKSGNLHTRAGAIVLMNPVSGPVSEEVGLRWRPDRFLDRRHEPLPRRGPYVVAMFNSSLSTISDRIGNYSLGRLLELELQAELGYREGLRVDLFQRSESVHTLAQGTRRLARYLDGEGPAPDVILFELHDLGGRFSSSLGDAEAQRAALGELVELAARHDSLLLLYDNSAMAGEQRDGLRATSPGLRALIDQAKAMGVTVLEPSDWLLRELLRDSPWGNQPWERGEHHGATWAVERTAQALGSMSAPLIREHLRGRVPARLGEEGRGD